MNDPATNRTTIWLFRPITPNTGLLLALVGSAAGFVFGFWLRGALL